MNPLVCQECGSESGSLIAGLCQSCSDKVKVVSIYGESLEIVEAENKTSLCLSHHKRIQVDEQDRVIRCAECGKVLSPFDYLMDWAREGTRRMSKLDYLDSEIRRKNTELELIKSVLAREKAKVRKINPDAPEVITWKRQIQKMKRTA